MWRVRQTVALIRLQFALSILTIISSGSLFVIDCALLSIYILNSANIFFAGLLLVELVSSIMLFCATMPFLVGGSWIASITQNDSNSVSFWKFLDIFSHFWTFLYTFLDIFSHFWTFLDTFLDIF